ncbi:MAG TPA: flagellar basal body rod C-terminal domain-containing protein [Dermatophilaceae bacterium]|nr:flagellar basal body rod C-terminal domain-containing protein [Dermatophilaceae bacterium]
MSIFGAMNIAGSGLVVNRKWLDAVSDNIANMNNVSAMTDRAFQARYVVAEANQYGQSGGVYVAGNMWGNPNGRVIDMTGHPLADALGRVRVPDLDLAEQMAQLMVAQRAYQANLAVVDRTKLAYEAAIGIGK